MPDITPSHAVRSSVAGDTASQLLSKATNVLIGVSDSIATTLSELGIRTIFDLAASRIFGDAREILVASVQADGPFRERIAGDFVDAGYRNRSPKQIAQLPLGALRGISNGTAKKLRETLELRTVHELAQWPPYLTARSIFSAAVGAEPATLGDPERPDDLIPISRRYATERVQYDIIVMDRVIAKPNAGPMTHVPPPGPDDLPPIDLVTEGGIDIAKIVAKGPVAKPAIGAVLTYRQSWYPQGLALGHLLHSMALAPGESTRLAVVDWTRTTRTRTDDETAQSELVTSDLVRSRAMSEVTTSVANEAQRGFSGSTTNAHQKQEGTTSGGARASVEINPFGFYGDVFNSLKGVFEGVKFDLSKVDLGNLDLSKIDLGKVDLSKLKFPGPIEPLAFKTSSGGSSSAESWSDSYTAGWASSSGERTIHSEMMQNITDRTHQAANSVRNRRATSVTETSQSESERLSTRVVTNYNHMHALTIQYFEVVQIYRVVVDLARKSRCLFVPMKPINFDAAVFQRYRAAIAEAGLIPTVRALRDVRPGQVEVVMNNKVGSWEELELDRLREIGGGESADPADRAVSLPTAGLEFGKLGSYDLAFGDLFDEVEITHRDGGGTRVPLTGADRLYVFDDNFLHFVQLKDLSPKETSAITLVRKAGGEREGSVNLKLHLQLRFKDVDQDGQSRNISIKLIATTGYQKTAGRLTVLEFRQTISENALLKHLNEHTFHYSNAIWRSLSPVEIMTMLTSYSFEGAPLVQSVDPVPVAVAGNYVVFRLYGGEKSKYWMDFLEKHGLKNPESTEDLIPLPSGGLFAEAVLGRSNSAEKVDITRFWNWQDSPIPILPPEISPLQAGSRARDLDTGTSPLESPVVNIVNPPALPDPAGLGPLYSAIANGSMFRDMSGLAQTAALAQAALQAAQAGAGQATTAAGKAQQVAAQQLTEFLKLVAQVAAAALTGGASAAGGAGAGLLGALAGGVSKSPTNAGALINQGAKMDATSKPNSSPSGPAGTGAGATGSAPSGSGAAGIPDMSGNAGNEAAAFQAALGDSGGGGGFMSVVARTLANAVFGTSLQTRPPAEAHAVERERIAANNTKTLSAELTQRFTYFGHTSSGSFERVPIDLHYWFAKLYEVITYEEIKAVEQRQHPAFMLKFVPVFYNLYYEAIQRHLMKWPGVPVHWQVHFADADAEIDTASLAPYLKQITTCVISGVKAHITGDMASALEQTYLNYKSDYPALTPDFDNLRPDFFGHDPEIFKHVKANFFLDLSRITLPFPSADVGQALFGAGDELIDGLSIATIVSWRSEAWTAARDALLR